LQNNTCTTGGDPGVSVVADRPVFAVQAGEIESASGGDLVLTYSQNGDYYRAEYRGMSSYDTSSGEWVSQGAKIGETAEGCFVFQLFRLR